jgi:hypothetical protein
VGGGCVHVSICVSSSACPFHDQVTHYRVVVAHLIADHVQAGEHRCVREDGREDAHPRVAQAVREQRQGLQGLWCVCVCVRVCVCVYGCMSVT